jgi:tetratricopeptide (TPR) repeat protein
MLLGDVYMNKEMIDEATEVYLEAVQMDPSDANLGNFIRAAETLNNYAAYEQGMELIQSISEQYANRLDDEQEIELLSLQSEINISLGKGAEAAANLQALLKKDPFNARALLSLARYYSDLDPADDLDEIEADTQRKRYEQQAIIYYERAQELDDPMAQVRAYIGEAQLRVQRDELDRAASLLEDAQSVSYQDNVQQYLDQIRAALKSRRRS